MKKRFVNKPQPRYEVSYKQKKLEEKKERDFKRELGIKAGYKKLLRKEELGGDSRIPTKLNDDKDKSISKSLPSTQAWSVDNTLTPPSGSKPAERKGWKVSGSESSPRAIPVEKRSTTDWTPAKVKPETTPSLLNKTSPRGWNIAASSRRDNTSGDKFDLNDNQKSRAFDSQVPEPRRRNNDQGAQGPRGKPSALKKAKNVFAQREQERADKTATFEQRQKERDEALKNRKKKRLEKFKILNQKTSKGQPVMKGRMELLLQKIQSGIS